MDLYTPKITRTVFFSLDDEIDFFHVFYLIVYSTVIELNYYFVVLIKKREIKKLKIGRFLIPPASDSFIEMIKIEYLKNYPEHLCTAVGWVYPEWWHYRYSFEDVVTLYRSLLNDYSLPVALIAFKDDIPVGTALICEEDPDIKEGVSPWLEGLFVKKEFRECGIGTALVERIEIIARNFGYGNLYLSSGLENFYQNMDYKVIKKLENGDTLFGKKLR